MLGTTVIGGDGNEIGEVSNIIVGTDGTIEALIVESGGFLDIGDTHFRVSWQQVEVAPALDSVQVPVTEENIDQFTLFETRGAEEGPEATPRAWRATELIGDYVYLEGEVAYGYVEDLVFSDQGRLLSVVVEPDVTYGVAGPYALPYYGYGYGFDPGLDTYTLPYTTEDIAALETFDYGAMEAGAAVE